MGITAERAFFCFLERKDYRSAMIQWAMSRLEAGSGCESTALLAGADFEQDDEVLRLFRSAASEEGIGLPNPQDELPWLEQRLCMEIAGGALEPQAGLAALSGLWARSGYEQRFARWLYLSESVVLLEEGYGGLEPFHEMTLEELDSTIVREAGHLLEFGKSGSIISST